MKSILDLASHSAHWTTYVLWAFDFLLTEKLKQGCNELEKYSLPGSLAILLHLFHSPHFVFWIFERRLQIIRIHPVCQVYLLRISLFSCVALLCCLRVSRLRLLATLWISDVHSVLSPNGFSSGIHPAHIWSSFSPAALYFPQHSYLFRRTLYSHDVPPK